MLYEIGSKLRIKEDEMGAPIGTVVTVKSYRRIGRYMHYEYEYGEPGRMWIASEEAVEPADSEDD